MLSPNKLKAVQTLISKTDNRDEKANIVSQYTNGRTESVREMNEQEAARLIDDLKRLAPNHKATHGGEKMRRKLISMAHELGWKLSNGKIDMKRVNEWCVKYGHKHVALNQYTYNDLPQLLSQFEKMYFQFIQAV